MSKMGLHDPFGHLQHKLWPKRKAGSQIGNLTLDHKKSGINQTYVRADEMQYTIGKLLMKSTTLL